MSDSAPGTDNAYAVAQILVDAFLQYNANFRALTRRAADCFESRDWQRGRDNAVARIELYERAVSRAISELTPSLPEGEQARDLWRAVKVEYAALIRDYPDNEFFKTFFSSISRRVFQTVGVDSGIEFLAADVQVDEKPLDEKDIRTYYNRGSLRFLVDQVLSDSVQDLA